MQEYNDKENIICLKFIKDRRLTWDMKQQAFHKKEEDRKMEIPPSIMPKQWLDYMMYRLGNKVNGKHDNFFAIAVIYNKHGREKKASDVHWINGIAD